MIFPPLVGLRLGNVLALVVVASHAEKFDERLRFGFVLKTSGAEAGLLEIASRIYFRERGSAVAETTFIPPRVLTVCWPSENGVASGSSSDDGPTFITRLTLTPK